MGLPALNWPGTADLLDVGERHSILQSGYEQACMCVCVYVFEFVRMYWTHYMRLLPDLTINVTSQLSVCRLTCVAR